nr:FAD-dependent oxidoreductase [uncultured Rhodoferax sp.]
MRIGIAGAGVLGRLLAFTLSRAGHDVQVFDPASGPGPRADSGSQAAGWTAAGMLSPVAELERAGAEVFALGVRSCQLWPQIVQALSLPVALHMQGSLLLAHRSDAGAAQRVVGLLQAKADAPYQPQPLTMDALRSLEPSIQGPALAWQLPSEGQIHPVQAMQALAAQAAAQGVQWHWGRQVTQVEAGALIVADASLAVRAEPFDKLRTGPVEALRQAQGERIGLALQSAVANGQRHAFDHVFDVRGLGAKPALPVRGVRGEVFWLHAPGLPLHRPVRLLHPRHSIYMVPRPGDVIVVGASEIESEDRSPVSLRSTLELLSAAHSVMPALAEARVVHLETNLRPALPDNLPAIRHSAGKTEINGLFRHGWLIAPALVEQALQELPL